MSLALTEWQNIPNGKILEIRRIFLAWAEMNVVEIKTIQGDKLYLRCPIYLEEYLEQYKQSGIFKKTFLHIHGRKKISIVKVDDDNQMEYEVFHHGITGCDELTF